MPPKLPKPFRKRYTLIILLFPVGFIILYFILLTTPSNNRPWQDQYSVLPHVEINNNVTIQGVRDWRYDGENTISKNYIDRTFDPSKITRVWFLMEPFGSFKAVAHTYFVFDFENEPPIAISVEARREEQEDYSGLWGFFNKYELIYVWGTEDDETIRRAVVYKDRLYMFPLTISKDGAQKLFVQLAQETKNLETTPRFYNTLTSNCTNELAKNANKVKPGEIPFLYSLLPGYSAEALYKLRLIDNAKSLDEIQSKYFITDEVQKIYKDKDFSKKLREYLN